MTPDRRKRLEDEEKAIFKLWDTYVIDADTYAKRTLSLAYQYVLAGDPSRATPLLCKSSEVYYRQIMPLQMQKDAVFCEEVFRLAEGLVSSGVVNLEKEYLFLRAPAKA